MVPEGFAEADGVEDSMKHWGHWQLEPGVVVNFVFAGWDH